MQPTVHTLTHENNYDLGCGGKTRNDTVRCLKIWGWSTAAILIYVLHGQRLNFRHETHVSASRHRQFRRLQYKLLCEAAEQRMNIIATRQCCNLHYSLLNFSLTDHDYDAWRHAAAYAVATWNICIRTRHPQRRSHNQAIAALNHKDILCPGQPSTKWSAHINVTCTGQSDLHQTTGWTAKHPNRFRGAPKLPVGVHSPGVQRPERQADHNSAKCPG